jgi:hypothetical protein
MESHTAKVPSCSSFSTSFPESFWRCEPSSNNYSRID